MSGPVRESDLLWTPGPERIENALLTRFRRWLETEHGRKFASNANPVVNGIIGNWSVSAIWNWQSGRPRIARR